MKRLLQINITANWGSHGKIAEGIGRLAMDHGWESVIAYGRWSNPSQSRLYHIGSMMDERWHCMAARLLDNQGLMSRGATARLIAFINNYRPSLIHLHNIHGYYLHYPMLFEYLSQAGIPVVWTLHDCWPFTGHCANYIYADCEKWQTHCHHCPQIGTYPKSYFMDRSARNYDLKRTAFTSVPRLTIVPVCQWLKGEVARSFLKDLPTHLIYNGIDLDVFRPSADKETVKKKYGISADKHLILGVASNWYRKGLEDFFLLRRSLPDDYAVAVVGLNRAEEEKARRHGLIGIRRTGNVGELTSLYTLADVYCNPTWEDNFPTTNLEAMACGTPVVAYRTGGCPEAITSETGIVVDRGDVEGMARAIRAIVDDGADRYERACRQHIEANYDQKQRFAEYLHLYESMIK